MRTFKTNLLGLALAGLILGACSQTATYETADLMNEQAAAEKGGFKLDPFGMGGENTKAYVECEDRTAADCITEDPLTWYKKSASGDYTSNQGSANVEIYNTPTHIVYSITSSTGSDLRRVTFNGTNIYSNNTPSAEPLVYSIPLGVFGEDWTACQEVNATIEIRRVNSSGTGTGQYMKIETSYDLVPVCVVEEEECEISLTKVFKEVDGEGYHVYEFTLVSDTDIPNGENWEIQLTTPQILGYKSFDGKIYTGFGEEKENVLRWDGVITKCIPITFKIGFLPNCDDIDQENKKNPNAMLVTVFNVKGKGNQLGGPISIKCNN
ncbi:hypothetical protein [Algoriphagus sp. AK58]|uniref:hypothetical protein n=1 Tax=Algoriphagus sp. AK58 TaxID=1406877 RepID=UPI00164FA3CA|nr:hypothetical protein [Algoriphagus sp. AK58]MBC6365519.1 hypothetical protein [Algoriphagus sp. AK58]